ncbi:MAG: hypothetical protein WCK14_01540 [Actinomycetota bacterium]|jgi:hypothetical protein
MTWLRAIVSGVVIVGIAFVLLVVVPHMMLSKITSFERGGRVALATGWFAASLTGLLWGLRRLQSRHII